MLKILQINRSASLRADRYLRKYGYKILRSSVLGKLQFGCVYLLEELATNGLTETSLENFEYMPSS